MIRSGDKQFPPLQTRMAKHTSQSITLTTHHYNLASTRWMRTRSKPCLLLHLHRPDCDSMGRNELNELVDEDDAKETLEGLLYLCDARVLFHHQEIGFSVFTEPANPSKEESSTCVFIPYNDD